jgi:hypothetical protein
MSTEIESLELKISSNSTRAVKGIDALTQSLAKLKNATKGLGLSTVAEDIRDVGDATKEVGDSGEIAKKSFTDVYHQIKTIASGFKAIGKAIYSAIGRSSDYVENVNLFTVSMGEYASEAKRYAETVGEVMGIDPGEWMRNQGVFMTLATGFGVASDRASVMSKNLTQLGYDLSSFFNISYEDAMEKLQSGLAGELEPLRRIGYDLSQAELEATALELGIDKSVSSMNQAEKAQLRYYAIMTQVTTAHGDMARTLDAPANQLKVLKAQFNMAAREIGNVFIPALNAILPPLIAGVKIIRLLANSIANLFGFEMPEVDYSGVDTMGGVAEDTSDAMGEAAESAKKLKSYMLGFDELNVINPNEGASSSIEDDSGQFDFDLPEYDFMADAVNSKVNKIVEEMKEWLGLTGEINSLSDLMNTNLGKILETVGLIGVGIGAWKISKMVDSLATAIKKNKLNKVAMGISLMVTGIALELNGAYSLGYEGVNFENIVKTAIGSALGIVGALLTFGTTPAGWAVGIGLALTMLVTGISMGVSKRLKEEDLAKRFGDYVLSDSEIKDFVKKITDTPLGVSLNVVVDEINARNGVKARVEESITELNSLNFKIQCGVEIPKERYQTAMDTFLASAEEYLSQNEIVAKTSISIIYDESATGIRLSEFVTTFYNTSFTKLEALGNDLKECVEKGFVDGKWIGDTQKEALELQKEIQEILDYISEVEFEAKITALKLDALEDAITPESFEKLLAEAQDIVQSNIDNLEGVRLEALKVAKMEFDYNITQDMGEAEAQKIYDQAVAEADRKFREGTLELNYGTFDFGIDTIMSAYSGEIDLATPLFQEKTESLFMKGTMVALPEETYDNVMILFSQLHDAYVFGLDDLDISPAARKNIKELVKALSPTEEQYLKIAKDALLAGESVPENVSKGLNDINKLKAISGDLKAINYMIGQHLSTDSSFLDMLTTSKGAGETVGQYVASGLLNNLQVVEDAANGTITLMNDTIGTKVFEVTPTLVENLEALGVNLSEGLLKGAEEQIEVDKKKWYEWSWLPWNWFKSTNEINSPSELFARGGAFIADGLFKGVDGGVSETSYTTIFDRISDALGGTKDTIKSVINSILKFIESMANGVVKGINRVINALNRLKIDVPDWVTDLTGISDFGFNIPTLTEISIPRLAEGGFPERGQMFIAREAGAEMVGSIGRRTAVANNDQIVSGIAGGVAEANEEQNALLREQNALLRAILEKDSGTYLDGKDLTHSVEKYQRERGRVIITGGVV